MENHQVFALNILSSVLNVLLNNRTNKLSMELQKQMQQDFIFYKFMIHKGTKKT